LPDGAPGQTRYKPIVSGGSAMLKSALFLALLATAAHAAPPPTGAAIPPSDIPAKFAPVKPAQRFTVREVMIPMRDGAKLHTYIVIAKGLTHAPMLLSRTPYGAGQALHQDATRIDGLLSGAAAQLAEAGYIIVLQDIRGRFGSEGDYRMLRPLVGPLNATKVDHATDAYDTIDWLVKNVPQSNGRVGTIGTSYVGFTTLMSLIHPHPALKAAVPFNPVVDIWTGDDLFHHGAFRETYLDWVYSLVSDKSSALPWPEPRYDAYQTWLSAGSAGAAAKAQGMDNLPYWQRITEHPAYDPYWQEQALDRTLADAPLSVPTLHVHSQWDQEDIYGAPAAYAAMESKDRANNANFLVIGPWRHGGANGTGTELGAIKFGEDTAAKFRRDVLIPFLDAHLKDGAPKAEIAPVTVFETGSNVWRHYDRWPQSCDSGCPAKSQALYLQPGHALAFSPPAPGGQTFDEYVSDPAKPVTYRLRPIRPTYSQDSSWGRWLVDDQRFAEDRPDVLTYVSPVLTAPVRIAGQPIAHLIASTSGSDSDWVVKLIDVYPDQTPKQPEMGGYELPIAMDILRGRYRDDPAHPSPIPSDQPIRYTLKLPNADHVFLPGHRIMVQIQSSWFPLYDRNPQTYVPNIFFAKPEDYRKATQRVFHAPDAASFIELPVVP
jgi:putative CocE/NonD family hydrolase